MMAYDQFHEIPQQDALCCLYSIVEARMLHYVGFLAILKNKSDPTLFLNISQGMNFYDSFFVSGDGRLIFLQPCLYNEQCGIKTPILVIDLAENRFSYVLTDNIRSWHSVKQKSSDVFVVHTQEYDRVEQRQIEVPVMEFQLQPLQWHDLDQLNTLRQLVFPDEPKEAVTPKKRTWFPLFVVLNIALVLFALGNTLLNKATFIDYLIFLAQFLIVFPFYMTVLLRNN